MPGVKSGEKSRSGKLFKSGFLKSINERKEASPGVCEFTKIETIPLEAVFIKKSE